jgi:hypothetical protein
MQYVHRLGICMNTQGDESYPHSAVASTIRWKESSPTQPPNNTLSYTG